MSAGSPVMRYAELEDHVILRVTGEDAGIFLQGQLCGDVETLPVGEAMVTAATNAKGRVIAIVRVLRSSDHFDLVVAASLGPQLARRLQMYVLRAKVTIEGPDEAGIVFAAWSTESDQGTEQLRSVAAAGPGIFLLPGATTLLPGKDALAVLSAAGDVAVEPGSMADWNIHETLAGIPETDSRTSESFIPQMLNLDLIGGVSFEKGCYVGQEVIARAHHLGRVKRRSRLFCIAGPCRPVPGQSIFMDGRAAGKLARVAQTDDTCVVLAVTAGEDGLYLDADGSAQMKPHELPYALAG